MSRFLACLSLIASLAAVAAVAAPPPATLPLELRTRDDDLRAGGSVSFVLRMDDGTEQTQPLVNGTPLGNGSTVSFTVGPKPPYDWVRVRQYGLRVRPHPGDGMLLRPDEWKVAIVLRRGGSGCPSNRAPRPGEFCMGSQDASFHFRSEDTQLAPLRVAAGRCTTDLHCITSEDFCAPRTRRCAPSGGDWLGCVALARPEPPCAAGQLCVEARNQCTTPACENPDADGDGEDSITCGGGDCDDDDPRRRPGAAEICDADALDEDCDMSTFGDRDSDRDGFVDSACWNDPGR